MGVETPCVLVANEEVTSERGNFNTPGRLDGLLDFFRILEIKKDEFCTNDEIFKNIKFFSDSVAFDNKESWKPYAKELAKKCELFMAD